MRYAQCTGLANHVPEDQIRNSDSSEDSSDSSSSSSTSSENSSDGMVELGNEISGDAEGVEPISIDTPTEDSEQLHNSNQEREQHGEEETSTNDVGGRKRKHSGETHDDSNGGSGARILQPNLQPRGRSNSPNRINAREASTSDGRTNKYTTPERNGTNCIIPNEEEIRRAPKRPKGETSKTGHTRRSDEGTGGPIRPRRLDFGGALSSGGNRTEGETNEQTPNAAERTPDGQDEMDGRRLAESEINKQVEKKPWFTFITREKPAPSTAKGPNYSIADHGDHWHITYQATTKNNARTRNSIIDHINISAGASLEARASCINIKMVINWIFYLIRYGMEKLHHIGDINPIYKTIINYLSKFPRDEVDGPCPYMTSKREARKTSNDSKFNEYRYMKDLIELKKSTSVQHLLKNLNEEEMENLYTTVGAGFKDKMKIIFQYKKQQEDQTQGNRPLIENLAKKCNNEPKEENIKWLEYFTGKETSLHSMKIILKLHLILSLRRTYTWSPRQMRRLHQPLVRNKRNSTLLLQPL